MSEFYRDILIGMVFVLGLFCFISGEFIISSTLFGVAAISSNVNVNRKRRKAGQFLWD
jgi:hypothetical protein